MFEVRKMILTFDRGLKFIFTDVNIISANYFNEFMVEVEIEKKIEKGKGR